MTRGRFWMPWGALHGELTELRAQRRAVLDLCDARGAHPKPDRVRQVIDLILAAGREPLCLGTTKDGQPRHPLMLRNDAQLQPWAVPS